MSKRADLRVSLALAGLFDSAFLESEVVVEESRDEMPQDAGAEQIRLQPKVARKRGSAVRRHAAQLRQLPVGGCQGGWMAVVASSGWMAVVALSGSVEG